jgi:hypothetical protein
MEATMHDRTRQREARMMDAVAGMGGRSLAATEIDIRLGVGPSAGLGTREPGAPGWWQRAIARVRKAMARGDRQRPAPFTSAGPSARPGR